MRGAISHLQIIHDHRRRFLQDRGKRTSITVNNKYNTKYRRRHNLITLEDGL